MSKDESQWEQSTIKMGKPQSNIERLQALIESAGFKPDQFNVNHVKEASDGQGNDRHEVEITWTLPQEMAEKLIKALTIKPFNPDKDTVSFGDLETRLVSIEEVPEKEPTVKLWTGKEREKRSKPKSGTHDPNSL